MTRKMTNGFVQSGMMALFAALAAGAFAETSPLPLTCTLTGAQADLAFAARPTARAVYFAWGASDAGGRTNGWEHVEKLADVASGATAATATLPGTFDAATQKGRFFLYDVYTLASYVQDGLVIQYDAIDNAGTGTHDPAATTWKDLKGTNDITLAGLAFDGNRVLFPTSKRASFTLPLLATYGDLTVETIAGTDDDFRHSGGRDDFVNVGNDVCLAYRYDGCYFMAIFGEPTPASGARAARYCYSAWLGPVTEPGASFNDVKDLHHYAAVLQDVNNTKSTLRVDGTSVASPLTGYSWRNESFSNRSQKFTVGLSDGNSIFSCLRLYSRALTEAEQRHNWAVDRTRYQGAEPLHLVSPLVGTGAGANARAFRYATWNIGHFACGTNSVSSITSENAAAMKAAYGTYLDDLAADWFGVNEYAAGFTRDGTQDAAREVFGRYPVQIVGPQKDYQWNATFASSRFTVFETVTNFYTYHKQDVYYVASHVLVDDAYDAWFVQTHHDWQSATHRWLQTCQVIQDFASSPRVVVSGDFNISAKLGDGVTKVTEWSTLQRFLQSGYHTVNTGSLGGTYGTGTISIDHIHARGFTISNACVKLAGTLSDHHAVACTLTPTLLAVGGKTPVNVPADPPPQYFCDSWLTPVVTADAAYTVTWTNTFKNVGTYTGTATLVDPATTCWADGTTSDKTLTFKILKNVNWWRSVPTLSCKSWISGATNAQYVGWAQFGAPFARYTLDMLAELPAGSYTQRFAVAATADFGGVVYEIPFTVRDNLKATVSSETNADGVREATLTFAAADVARTVTLVYGNTDAGGANDAAWTHRVVLGTIPAGATSATFALPASVGTQDFFARVILATASDSTSYVQDGLVVQYDALENAGRGIACTTNAVWKDLIGSRDISAANLQFRGDVVYLPSNECMSVNVGTTCPATSTKSLELVVHTDETFDDSAMGRYDVGNIGNDGVIAFRGFDNYYILGIFVTHATRTAYYTDNKSSPYAKEPQLHVATAYSGVFAPVAADASLWVNGTVFTSGTNTASGVKNYYYNTSSGFSHNNYLKLPNGSRANLYYSSVRLYNRALTDAERAQNYAVDRIRFLGDDALRETTPTLTVPQAFTVTVNRRTATADLACTATNLTRRLYVAWGGGDHGGAATNAWPNVAALATVPSGTSLLADVALPRAALAATGVRFFLVDVYDSSSYVTNGLQIHWDALDNAGRGLHVAVTNIWKNLAAATNDLDVKTGTFAANYLFLGKNVIPSVTVDASLFPRTLSKTVEGVVWVDDESFDITISSRVDLISVCNDAVIMTRGVGTTFTGAIFVDQSGSAYYMTGRDLTRNSRAFLAQPQSYSLVNRTNAGESTMRINGAAYIRGNTNNGTSYPFHWTYFDHTRTVKIGNNRGTAKFGVVRVYNRTLSDAERDRNAAIDLVRYCGRAAPVLASDYVHFPNGTVVIMR